MLDYLPRSSPGKKEMPNVTDFIFNKGDGDLQIVPFILTDENANRLYSQGLVFNESLALYIPILREIIGKDRD